MAWQDAAAGVLARALTFPTVSSQMDRPETRTAFRELLDSLEAAFPALYGAARVEREDPWQLVLEVPGADPSLDPLLLLAHFDVVAVEAGSVADWSHDPFGGEVADGYIWGRGALDDKNVLIGILAAADAVVAAGKRFRRGLVIACGGDEELAGRMGAATIAARMQDAGRHFHFVLDEGAVVAEGMLGAPSEPIALIGIAEKGQVNIRIRAEASGGHAAMPPERTAVGRLAEGIRRVERTPPRPRLTPGVRAFFQALAPHTAGPLRLVYGHPGLFWPLLSRALAAGPTTAALIRTTQAVTMAEGSSAPNVLPKRADAIVNCRILPGERTEDVVNRYEALLGELGLTVHIADADDAFDPVPESALSHPGYLLIEEAARKGFPCITAPYLVTGSTDSKWYAPLADAVYRFVPMMLTGEEIGRIHGTDERISLENVRRLLDFYEHIITQECVNG